MALFPLPVIAEISDTFVMPTAKLRFGNGEVQLAKSGIQRPIEVWGIKVVYTSLAIGQTLDTFLESVGQHKVFQWQSPRDSAVRNYRITGDISGTKRNGGGSKPVFFTRSMQFKRSYNIEKPAQFVMISSSVNSVIEGSSGIGSSTNITITRDSFRETVEPLVVNLSVSGTATFGVDYTVVGAVTFTTTSAIVSIPANQASLTFSLISIPDAVFEPNETVVLSIMPTESVSTSVGSAVGWTIFNDDVAQ